MRTLIAVLLSSLVLALASSATVRADEKPRPEADADFLTKSLPGTAASVKIIEYAEKNASDEKVREFAKSVAKEHKEFVKTATDLAKRLKIVVVIDADKDSKETIDKLSNLKGVDVDIAFLEWLINLHKDPTLFEIEVKNGDDAALRALAKDAIVAGNEHLQGARELLAKIKK
jgi:putative membrane protein